MFSLRVLLLISAGLLAAADGVLAEHRLVLQGNDRLAIVTPEGEIEWETKWGGIHDIWQLPNGNLLVQQGSDKVVEISIKTKEIVWSYNSSQSNGNAGQRVEVHSFQPLEGERLMIAESGARRIIEVDR